MANLRFITSNPVTAAFREREQLEAERALREAQLANQEAALIESQYAAPSRLRQVTAAADNAEVVANVQRQTAPYQVSQAKTAAESAAFDLDRGRQLLPYEVSQSRTAADQAAFNLGKARELLPFEVSQARSAATEAGIRARDAGFARADAGFAASMRYLADGRPDLAQQIATYYGEPIPEEVMRDANLQRTMVQAWEDAQRLYPSSPQKQQQYVAKVVEGFVAAGGIRFDPAAGVTAPGIPEPDAVAATGRGGTQSVFQEKYQAWLSVHPGDHQGALEYASGRRIIQPADLYKMAQNMAQKEAAAGFGTAQQKADLIARRTQEIYQELLQLQGMDDRVPAGGGAPMADAGETMTGPDGNDYPSITTQEQYDALAPGAIYYDPSRQDFFTKGG